MNVQKQTYLNTVGLETRYQKTVTVKRSFGADRKRGGIFFTMKSKGRVCLSVDYRSLSGKVTVLLDGEVVACTAVPFVVAELKAEQGEHLFEAVTTATHGAFTMTAEGYSLEEEKVYADRVGGATSGSEGSVYIKNGKGAVDKYLLSGDALTRTEKSEIFYDEAYYYDRTQGQYTSTKRYCYATSESAFHVYTGTDCTFLYEDIGGLAICDARTLETGADYLVAFVDRGGVLRFLRVTDGAVTFGPNELATTTFSGMRRVVSAQRGSVFLAEDAGHVWHGYFFHPNGEKVLSFPSHVLHYDEYVLTRNRNCAPTATVDEEGAPVFYYKREEGALMRYPTGEVPTQIAYAEAFHPMPSGGLLQFGGELAVCTI